MGLTLKVVSLLSLVSAIYCGHFVKAPGSVVYRRGIDTTGYVVCEIDPPTLRVFWNIQTRSKHVPEVIYASPEFFSEELKVKYSVNADSEVTGNYTLTIHNLDRGDSGRYTCQGEGIGSSAANVTVADPPGVPSIILPTATLQEKKTITFSCTSEGGFPAPSFTWLLGGTQLPDSAHADSETGGVARSELRVELSHQHHMAKLSCISTNILSGSNNSIVLNVQYWPRVTVTPANLVVLKDKPFGLSCEVDANPALLTKQWLKENGDVFPSELFTTGVSVDTVLKCRAENSLGMGELATKITVHYAPVVSIARGAAVNATESTEVRILCEADSKPASTFSWYKGDQKVSEGAELVIDSVTKQHAGRYSCEATNSPSPSDGTGVPTSRRAEIDLNVQYGPESPTFEVNPSISSGEYRAGEKVILTCSMTNPGNPGGVIRWYKANSSTPIIGAAGPSLAIEYPEVTDSGVYWCQVENAISSKKSERRTLNFMDIPELEVIDNRKVRNESAGLENLELQCVYSGFPAPSIQWYKGDSPIYNDTKLYTIEQHSVTHTAPYLRVNSILKFVGENRQGLIIEDFSKYSCLASNSVGKSKQNYEVQLNVIFPPKFAGFGKEAAEEGMDVEIDCMVLSFPPATDIKFFRDGKLIEPLSNKYSLAPVELNVDNVVYQQNRALTVQAVSAADYGSYTCDAVNREGNVISKITLVRPSLPDPPTDFRFSSITWRSAVLLWTPSFDGGHKQTFAVTEATGGGYEPVEEIKDSQFTVTGLSPMRVYKFRVRASNKLGQSEAYNEITFSTPNLIIPLSTLIFDKDTMTVKVNITSTEYCSKLQGRVEDGPYEEVSEECLSNAEDVSVKSLPYTSYRVVSCVNNRSDVCSESPSVAAQVDKKGDQKVIIAVAVSIFLVLLVIVVVIAVVILRKKRQNHKSSPSGTKSGHINPIMTPNGVPGEVQYSTHNEYNINSDLEMDDEMDGLPYGEFRNNTESPAPAKQFQNLDYVYASVQKKSSEQNKLNDEANSAYQNKLAPPNNLNIHDPLSVSDNSEGGGYDEQPPSPYRSPTDLAFLGDGAMAFHRYPSISESGYSTPNSKQLKKVVYEVIV